MSRIEELEQVKKEYQKIEVPEQGMAQMEQAIRRAKMDKKRQNRNRMIRNWGIAAAAALVLVVLPNTNGNVAYAMGNLPVIGGFFQAVTIREYHYQDENNEANVQVPVIVAEDTESAETSEAIEQVNLDVREYTDQLVAEFEAEMTAEGHSGLEISYEEVMNTADWYTLKIDGLQVQASGFAFSRYYHIDKVSGKVATLRDLFVENTDYVTIISDEIKKQMLEQTETGEGSYFMEDDEYAEGFVQIEEEQNFYLNQEGQIVIVFDEYEVAPGYMGSPSFVIPQDVVSDIRK